MKLKRKIGITILTLGISTIGMIIGLSMSNPKVTKAEGEEFDLVFELNDETIQDYLQDDDYYYLFEEGYYNLTSDITLDFPIVIEYGKPVTINLKGHVLDLNEFGFDRYDDLTITDDQETAHYFAYSKADNWKYISTPSEEQIDSAIEVKDITEETQDEDIIQVYGGVITNAYVLFVRDNIQHTSVILENINFIGNNDISIDIDIGYHYKMINTKIYGNSAYDKTLISVANGGFVEFYNCDIEHNVCYGTLYGWGGFNVDIYGNTIIQNNYILLSENIEERYLCNVITSSSTYDFQDDYCGSVGFTLANMNSNVMASYKYEDFTLFTSDNEDCFITTEIDGDNYYIYYLNPFYKVTFYKGSFDDVEIIKVKAGELVTPPEDMPDIEDFKFECWTADIYDYGINPFDFSTPITSDLELYGVYFPKFEEPTEENDYTISSNLELNYQWYKTNVNREYELDMYDVYEDTFYLDENGNEIYLSAGTLPYYGVINNVYYTTLDEVQQAIIDLVIRVDCTSCYMEFEYYGNEELKDKNTILKKYNIDGKIENVQYGTITKIGNNTYRYDFLTDEKEFVLLLNYDFQIHYPTLYYCADEAVYGYTYPRLGNELGIIYEAGDYYCVLEYGESYAGRSQIVTAYGVDIYINEEDEQPYTSFAMLKNEKIGEYILEAYSSIGDVKIDKWEYIKDGKKYVVNGDLLLTENISIYPSYTLDEKELTNEYLATLPEENFYYSNCVFLPSGKYTLTEDLNLQHTLGVNFDSIVEIDLNGYTVNCNNFGFMKNGGSLKVYGGQTLKDYYFDYSNYCWSYISSPTSEQIANAISLDKLDPYDTSEKEYKIVKVQGYGLITGSHNAIDNIYGSSYYTNVLIIGHSAYNSPVISTGVCDMVYLKNCEMYGNYAENCGGVVWASKGTTIDGCIMKFNHAGKYGGAIYSTDYFIKIKGNTIIQLNFADGADDKLNNTMSFGFESGLEFDDSFNGSIGIGYDDFTNLVSFEFGVTKTDITKYLTIDHEEGFAVVVIENEYSDYYDLQVRRLFTVDFVTYDENTSIESIRVPFESFISEPSEIPSKYGYTFIGWSTSDEYMYMFDFDEYYVAYDITLYAMYKINFEEPTAENNYTIVLENKDADVEYYWYMEDDLFEFTLGTNDFYGLFNIDLGILEDNTLYSEYYDVSPSKGVNAICVYSYYIIEGSYVEFNYSGSTSLSPAFVVCEEYYADGSEYYISGTLEKIGDGRYRYYFNPITNLWGEKYFQLYIENTSEFSISDVHFYAYASNYIVNETASLGKVDKVGSYRCEIYYDDNFRCYSKTIHAYDVALYDNKELTTSLQQAIILEGTTLQEIISKVNLTKENYTLTWYNITSQGDVKVDGNTKVQSNMKLYYKWELNQYKVSFNSKNYTNNIDVIVTHNEKVESIENPIREGYTFMGWYKDEECLEQWNFENDVVTKDLTLYAKWEKLDNDKPVEKVKKGVSADAVVGIAIGSSFLTLIALYFVLGFVVYKKDKLQGFFAIIYKWIK